MQFEDILKEKRLCKFTKWVLFLHENASSQRTLETKKNLSYLRFQCLDHPCCSPDLAPSEYHFFPGLINQCESHLFSSDAKVIATANIWLNGEYTAFFSVFHILEERAKKCIELRGAYAEYIPRFVAVASFFPGRAKDLPAALAYISLFPDRTYHICHILLSHILRATISIVNCVCL